MISYNQAKTQKPHKQKQRSDNQIPKQSKVIRGHTEKNLISAYKVGRFGKTLYCNIFKSGDFEILH